MTLNALQPLIKRYHEHSDLIKSVETTLLTTCVLVGKIWKAFPQTLPQISLLLLRYTGILFIGAQIQHCQKSYEDFKLALHYNDQIGMLTTASKVAVKSTAIFLTITSLVTPLLTLCYFQTSAAALTALLLPISRSSWFLGCLNEISDYLINKNLKKRLSLLGKKNDTTQRIHQLVLSFMALLNKEKIDTSNRESQLALQIMRQCSGSGLTVFQTSAFATQYDKNQGLTQSEEQHYFDELCATLQQKNHQTEEGTFLSSLGYVAMHISKIYPDGPLEWGLRWTMSTLYLMRTLEKKFFQQAQQNRIEKCLSN